MKDNPNFGKSRKKNKKQAKKNHLREAKFSVRELKNRFTGTQNSHTENTFLSLKLFVD